MLSGNLNGLSLPMRTWLYVLMEHVLTENPAVSDRFVLPDIVAACSASLAVVPRLSHGGRLLSDIDTSGT